jgi:hypothetical protein
MALLRLSDEQLTALMRLAAPLAAADRAPFLEAVAAKLAEHPELAGDGYVARVAAEFQKKFWRAPDLGVPSKYE